MFTGIIESIGSIRAMTPKGGDVRLLVETGKLDLGAALLTTLGLAEAEVEALNREADVARDAVRITITYGEERP